MKKSIFLGIILVLGLVSVSCKKEGCTDVDAENYNIDAKKNDGSCYFEGKHVIWYGENTANNLINDGATTLTYFVDGQIAGSSAANIYWTGAPECGQDASITISKDLGALKTQAYTYKVVDQSGWEYWTGVLNFNANTCTTLELTW